MVQQIEMLFAPYDKEMLDLHSLCGSWDRYQLWKFSVACVSGKVQYLGRKSKVTVSWLDICCKL